MKKTYEKPSVKKREVLQNIAALDISTSAPADNGVRPDLV